MLTVLDKFKTMMLAWFMLCLTGPVLAQDDCRSNGGCSCGQDIAPSGIMNDHLHEAGEWMISYRYMRMNMQGNILGSTTVSDNDVYDKYNYLMSPDKMSMDMHMLMVMYGLNSRVTLMVMPSYFSASMDMNMYGGGNATMTMPGMATTTMPNSQTVSGLGDTRLYALYGLVNNDDVQVVASAGLSIPTGNIDAKAFQSVYSDLHADYNMQPGTGTLDLMPGLSLLAHATGFDWGVQAMGTVHSFFNANGYRYGNEGIAELWAAKKWASWVSNSLRFEAIADGSMAGADARLYSVMEPSADAANYGGFKAYFYPGINFYPGTFFKTDIKLRLEYGLPLYQYAQGIQMAAQSVVSASLDFIF